MAGTTSIASIMSCHCPRSPRKNRVTSPKSQHADGSFGLCLSAGSVRTTRPADGDRRDEDRDRLQRVLHCRAFYAEAASPARYALERGDWKAAEGLTVRPSPSANVPGNHSISPAPSALREPAMPKPPSLMSRKLGELRGQASRGKGCSQAGPNRRRHPAPASPPPGCSTPTVKKDDALKAMSDAAEAEDRTEKHPVTPGVPKPASASFMARMLLDCGNAKEALTAFEATLKKEPNRLGAYAGAAKAAAQLGETTKAGGDTSARSSNKPANCKRNTRTEVADARTYLRYALGRLRGRYAGQCFGHSAPLR